ncbi:hypothetical protein [Moorena sp. SIO3H5]|uniref:hypothetical protein n=1 Tax=Moorena sp. SIO3H5 TaxID=2607834 RepID=UPI0013B69AE2|nr:hypothetical protein [Moorena sp. SIO3H5]NEO68906.1 hypothetical protein [Moorena sp. SIO3H5]
MRYSRLLSSSLLPDQKTIALGAQLRYSLLPRRKPLHWKHTSENCTQDTVFPLASCLLLTPF